MTENHNSSGAMGKRFHCYEMCGGKNSRIFCGLIFILLGLFLLGKRANWFPADFMIMFWPAVFVLTGVWFIILAFIRKRAKDQRGILHDRK